MDFVLGGFAGCCAGLFSNPFDVIKTRQQLQGELQKFSNDQKLPYRGLWQAMKSIVQSEGLIGLQKGLVPATAFQFVMNGSRLGFFQTVDSAHWTRNSAGEHSPILCIFWGGVAGIVGSSIGCPFYMAKTQIQAQSFGKYAVGYQHNHRGMFDALVKAYQHKGVAGLWRGFTGIVPRTAAGSAVQLSTFTHCKDFFLSCEIFNNSTFFTALASSMVTSVLLTLVQTPFDVIATRLFNQGLDANGKGLLYKNIFDCFAKTYRMEGIPGLYKGVVANYWRLAPHTVLHLTFWEQLKKWYGIYLLEKDGRNVKY